MVSQRKISCENLFQEAMNLLWVHNGWQRNKLLMRLSVLVV
ncbi:UNVERIFIED_CONTAM: hypothetical protein GTU68_057914 [Idotea baltica]|nr:hypothetical protein [Idotea baltica]